MALKINKEDIDRKESDISKAPEGSGVMEGVNKFMGNLNTTIENAGKLLGQYKTIKNKLTGNEEPPQPKQINPPPPPPNPIPSPLQPKPAEFKEITKRQKAETIFNELHEQVKPQIPRLKLITGDMILKWALKPENKERVLKEIEKRL